MDGRTDPRISPVSLRRIELFRDLPEEELRDLHSQLRLVRAPRGTVLFKQGEYAGAIYIIETGQVKVVSGTGSEQRVLDTLGPGTPIGDISLLAGGPMTSTVEVTIDAELLALSSEDFDLALRRHPTTAINLCRIMAQRLRELDEGRVYGGPDVTNRIVALAGGLRDAILLAQSLARQSGRKV